MYLSHLAVFVIVICLDPLDLHIQIPRLGSKWSHPRKIRLSLVSRQISSGPRARFSPFVSRDLHPTRELLLYLVVSFVFGLVVIKRHM